MVQSSSDFYHNCLAGKLSLDSFEMKKDGTTVLKLTVLPSLMQIHTCAKMIGDFDGVRVSLQTDKLVGNVRGCMGFAAQNNIYVPNTVLCHDLRDTVAKPYGKIGAVFSKVIDDREYRHLRYLSKSLKNKPICFTKQINTLIDIDNIYT